MQYENTQIYGKAIEVLGLVRETLEGLPAGYGFLADQMRRASSSILLNFAEGYGKNSRKDARRYFAIARGSTNEVAAAFDVACQFGVVESRRCAEAKGTCDHLARMLSRFRQ